VYCKFIFELNFVPQPAGWQVCDLAVIFFIGDANLLAAGRDAKRAKWNCSK